MGLGVAGTGDGRVEAEVLPQRLALKKHVYQYTSHSLSEVAKDMYLLKTVHLLKDIVAINVF